MLREQATGGPQPGTIVAMNGEAIVIGAGIAGLTAATVLAKSGARVTVYEHHNVPGGCASFYQRGGYRFEVGATVANGFGERGIHRRLFEFLGTGVKAERLDPAMAVHLPDRTIMRYGDARWKPERLRAFGPAYEPFWNAQESLADRAWQFATAVPALPVDAASIGALARSVSAGALPLILAQGRAVDSLFPADASQAFRTFVDAQLLITTQTTAAHADLSYGATALDMAREGVYHIPGGIGEIATALARAARRAGARIAYNTRVERLIVERGRTLGVVLADGTAHRCGTVVAAIPWENVRLLLGRNPRASRRRQRWGAVTAHIALAPGAIPDDLPLHHQIVNSYDAPLGESNSMFLSFSAPGETTRARNGGRALTMSTHTDAGAWWQAAKDGTYETRKARYAAQFLKALERIAGRPVSPVFTELGTPVTFERYTARYQGYVGGIPQTRGSANAFARSHRTAIRGLYRCGDTVFPGQSTVGVTLSALAVARSLGAEIP